MLGNIAKVTLSLAVLAAIAISAKYKGKNSEKTVAAEVGEEKLPLAKRLAPYGLLSIIALFDFVSYYCQLEGSVNIPASVLFPLLSGGSILLTAAVGMLILREKPTKSAVAGMVICLAGMCMFI